MTLPSTPTAPVARGSAKAGAADAERRLARRTRRAAPLGLLVLLVLYVVVATDGLTRLPLVHGDEMWNAAPAYKLATTGVYGSDLFAGFRGAEHRTYQFMPMLQLLLAVDFRVFGIGLLQIRLLSIAAGVVLLALVFIVGRQLGSPRVGLVAIWLLVTCRLASGSLETGIVLVDLTRQTRYHVLAAMFGLAALAACVRASRDVDRVSHGWIALGGALIGLAFMSHLYGAFWLPALALGLLARRGRRVWRGLVTMTAAAVVICLPLVVYVLDDWPSFVGQTHMYGERFRLFDPMFYARNVAAEINRYLPFGRRELRDVSIGTWLGFVGFPVAFLAAARAAGTDRGHARTVVVVALVVIAALFAALLKWKTFSYLLTPLPLAALLLSDFIVSAVSRARTIAGRAVVVTLTGILAVESGAALIERHQRAARTTPYDALVQRLSAQLPARGTILASHRYWLGLRDRDVRTWLVPLLMSDPETDNAPIPLDAALERVAPAAVVMDGIEFGSYFEGLADPQHPRHARWIELQRFLARHDARLTAEFSDPDYGWFRIYIVSSSPVAVRTLGARR